MKLRNLVVIFVFILIVACGNSSDSRRGRKPVYVKPSVDYKGKYRKGHLRACKHQKGCYKKPELFEVLLPNQG